MTKKNQKIINGVLNKEKKNLSKVAFETDTGFYYATDGFRMVRIEVSEMCNAEIPLFTDKDKVVLPNYKRNYQTANGSGLPYRRPRSCCKTRNCIGFSSARSRRAKQNPSACRG